MRTSKKSVFRIYKSVASDYVQFVSIGMPFLCCWMANETNQLWMYGIAVFAAIVAVYVLNLFAARLVLNTDGITLIRNFRRIHIPWDSIMFTEIIALQPYGFSYPVEILCFSTQKHNPTVIRESKYLPQLSKDFVFLILNDRVRSEIVNLLPHEVIRRMRTRPWIEDSQKRIFQAVSRNKWIALGVMYLFALLLAYILIRLK